VTVVQSIRPRVTSGADQGPASHREGQGDPQRRPLLPRDGDCRGAVHIKAQLLELPLVDPLPTSSASLAATDDEE
jgi:hypothetical protein